MDEAGTFCERCGLDRDRLGSAGAGSFRVCPECSSSCCSNCWNQVAGRCLACRPFRLAAEAPDDGPPVRRDRVVARTRTTPTTVARRTARAAMREAGAAIVVPSGRIARRGLGKAARLSLVAAIAFGAIVGARVATFGGGPVAAQHPIVTAPLGGAPTGTNVAGSLAPDATTPVATSVPSAADDRPSRTGRGRGTAGGSGGSRDGSHGSGETGTGGSDGAGGSTPNPIGTAHPTATAEPTDSPTATEEPTPSPTAEPIVTPTPDPTDTPTPDPTDTPAPDPTDTP